MPLDGDQVGQIVDAIKSLKTTASYWDQLFDKAIPVFLGALSGVAVWLITDSLKTWREKSKASFEREKKELSQLNVALTAMSYNIESLLHIAMQMVLPHRNQSHAAEEVALSITTPLELKAFAESVNDTYAAMITRCPEPHFVELEFFKEIPFILEKDPEILKISGWAVSYTRALTSILRERNKHIDMITINAPRDGFKFDEMKFNIHTQAHLGNMEVINLLQLFYSILAMSRRLAKLIEGYDAKLGTRLRVVNPAPLDDTLRDLRNIAVAINPDFPAPMN